MQADNLQLRDIQLPDPVSWWPPALGWWLVLLALILLLVTVIFLFKKWRKKRHSVKVLTRNELRQIEKNFSQNADQKELIDNLSSLLRRASLSSFPREECASLTGEEWLTFLDQIVSGQRFSQGVGRTLITAPYEKSLDINSEELIALCKDWIEALP